jgi:hypothetical protein
LDNAHRDAHAAAEECWVGQQDDGPIDIFDAAETCAATPPNAQGCSDCCASVYALAVGHKRDVTDAEWQEIAEGELKVQAVLLRDIFGNPFRPVTFEPEWRTSTALALAKQMYDSRDFSAMAILADALQDAGCENDDVLSHCRDANGVHVRGCWVVDLVLGKS